MLFRITAEKGVAVYTLTSQEMQAKFASFCQEKLKKGEVLPLFAGSKRPDHARAHVPGQLSGVCWVFL